MTELKRAWHLIFPALFSSFGSCGDASFGFGLEEMDGLRYVAPKTPSWGFLCATSRLATSERHDVAGRGG